MEVAMKQLPIIYCQKCKNKITNRELITCPNCNNVLHKRAECLIAQQKNFRNVTKCSVCGEETYSFSERSCPKCGQYLFSYHFGCGKIFINKKNTEKP